MRVFSLLCLAALLLAAAGRAADLNVEDQRRLADGLYRREMYELAAREYAALLAADDAIERRDEVLFRMAESLRHIGKREDAERAYRLVMIRYPESPYRARSAFKRGVLLMEMEFYEGAAELFQTLLETENDLPADVRESLWFHRGVSLLRAGKGDAAVEAFDALRREFPESAYAPTANLQTAWVLSESDREEDRRRGIELARALAESPPSPKIGAQALYLLGRMAMDGDDHTQAAEAFLRLLKEYPDSPPARKAFSPAAWSCYRAGRFSDALRLSLAAIERDSEEASLDEWLYLKANCERELMQPEAALETYARLLKTFPQSDYQASARYEMALTSFKNGRHEEVLRLAQDARDLPDALRESWLWLQAEAAAALSDSPRAIDYYRRLIEHFPDGEYAADAMYRLAYHLREAGDLENAARYFRQLAETHPAHSLAPRALYAAGRCRAQTGKPDHALRDWSEFLARYPDHEIADEVLFEKAAEEMRQERSREALATLDALLRRFPDTPRRAEALFWRGFLLHKTDDTAEAEKTLRQALEVPPELTLRREIEFLLGLVLLRQDREEEAAALFQPLLQAPIIERFSPERLRWLAEFQYERGAWSAAEIAAEAMLRSTEDPAWRQAALTLLGRSLRAQGKREAAMEAFSEALAREADSRYAAEAALRLGEMRLQSGREEEAESLLRRAAARASNAEGLQRIRAMAYSALGDLEVQRDHPEAAVRYFLSVGLLFDDPDLTPPAMRKAAEQLERLGRNRERDSVIAELLERYPDSPAAESLGEKTDRDPENAP